MPFKSFPSRSPFSRTFYRQDPALPLMLFESDGGGGNPKPPVAPKENIDALVEAKVASILASNKAGGDKDEALKILARALHVQEGRASTAETALADAQKMALSDADKADLAALRELGIKPGEAKAEIQSGRTAKEQSAENNRLSTLEEAATVLGLRATALKRLSPKLEVIKEQIDVKGADGKMAKEARYFFKDGETKTGIVEFFEADKDAMELLASNGETAAPKLTPYAPGAPVGTGKSQSVWDKIREEKKAPKEESAPKSWQEQIGLG